MIHTDISANKNTTKGSKAKDRPVGHKVLPTCIAALERFIAERNSLR